MDQSAAPGLSSDSSISSTLLGGIRRLDSDAWRRLAQLFGPDVYRRARKAGLQPSDASDVMQEVFRAVAANVGDFRRDRPNDSFRGWLWTITQNKIRDHFRREAAVDQAAGGTDAQRFLESIPETPPIDDGSSSAPQIKGRVSRRALDLIRSEFEEHSWQAFWRAVVDGVPAVEVARELGMTAGAVRQAKYRILRRFRQETDGLLD